MCDKSKTLNLNKTKIYPQGKMDNMNMSLHFISQERDIFTCAMLHFPNNIVMSNCCWQSETSDSISNSALHVNFKTETCTRTQRFFSAVVFTLTVTVTVI